MKIGLLMGKIKHKSLTFITDAEGSIKDSQTIVSRELMRRYALIEKAKEKNVFGILINSATVNNFQETYRRTKKVLEGQKKKHFTLMINNITEAKLGNFSEIDVFVIISCPNHSLYSEKEFHRLVITPYELELALDSEKTWENSIVLDHSFGFKEEIKSKMEECKEEKNELQGNMMVLKNQNDQIQVRQVFQTLDVFEQKTFKGLEIAQNVPVTLAEKGLKGIASEYEDEKR